MFQESVSITIFGFILAILMSVTCNRYDIEQQAVKLYKADLATVVSRFRRTPDYLKILEIKKRDMNAVLMDVSALIRDYHKRRIAARVDEALGLQFNGTRRSALAQAMAAYYLKPALIQRRNEEGADDEEKEPGVELLDNYHLLHSPLSIQQRNTMRNLGFEFAGNAIHSVIQSFESGDRRLVSTRQPGGGNDLRTTDHISVHTVTSEPMVPHRARVSLDMPSGESSSAAMKHQKRYKHVDKTRL